MSIETATFVGDLQPANPPSTDLRAQGDDHLRLIKQVLQNTFPSLERAYYVPATAAKSASYSVVAADGEKTFYTTTTGGAVTYTLPTTLGATDAGWQVHFLKVTSDVNPMFITPGTGTINSGGISGLATARRCIPGVRVSAIWNGTSFFVTRALAIPLGTMLDYGGSALPAGFEWPNGQVLSSSAIYPEYFSANGGVGTTLDLRGRVAVTLDNLGGSSAGRLSGGVITGTAIGNTGGVDVRTLSTSNLAAYTPSGTIALSAGGPNPSAVASGAGTASFVAGTVVALGYPTAAYNVITATFTGSAQGGSATAFGILQPSIMCGKILVVE